MCKSGKLFCVIYSFIFKISMVIYLKIFNRGEIKMEKLQLNSKKIIIWLCVNYGIFIIAFLVLGTLGSENRMILWINFFLNITICVISLVLNIILFFSKYKTSVLIKIVLLFISLFLAAFTYYAFIMPECGLPSVLFS